jgi:putative membrane protein insertion efficiency factor
VFARVMVRAIRFYQRTLSPLTGPSCRFAPSCSEYAAVAIDRHGPLSGGWLALRRILRCHPFGGQGFDPVPDLVAAELMGSHEDVG